MKKRECIVLLLLIFGISQIFAAACGDVNNDGVVDIVDALLIAQEYVNLNPENFDSSMADVNGDGLVDIIDGLLVAQYYVQLIDALDGCDTLITGGPTLDPTPDGEEKTYELQAETEATWSSGQVERDHSGYTGTGYVNTDNSSGEWIEWTIEITANTNTRCVFTYACASDARPMALSLNGNAIADLAFPASGAWTTWATEEATFSLTAGSNKIRLTATVSAGAANIDKMDITMGQTIVTPPPPTPTPTLDPNQTPDPIPNVVEGGEPIGMAVYPDDGIESTTGGGDGEVVTARSGSELNSYAGGTEPRYIIVEGSISGNISIGSNKTIIGAGSGATIKGGLDIRDQKNIIIRNLTISGGVDAIATRGTSHVWIDHCDVGGCSDGAIDITKESDYHTVSWTRFHNHDKTMLINSGTGQDADEDDLNTTVHHCWYDGTNQRNPRAAYGDIHVFNTMYNNNGSYCIGLHSRCMVLSEHNYFQNTEDPIHQMYEDDPNSPHHGYAKDVGSIFDNIDGDIDTEDNLMTVNFETRYYMYRFALDAAADVPSIVKAKAGPGPEYSTLGPMPVPGNGAIKVSTNPTLRWTRGHSATSYVVHFGTSSPPPVVAEITGQTYAPGSLSSGTIYYWSVDLVNGSACVDGNIWCFKTE